MRRRYDYLVTDAGSGRWTTDLSVALAWWLAGTGKLVRYPLGGGDGEVMLTEDDYRGPVPGLRPAGK